MPAYYTRRVEDQTFVVTAVDGAATLWERAPEAMLEAIERHDLSIRAAVKSHGGVEERRGAADGFVVRFEEAASAVRFCLEAQQVLRAKRSGTSLPIRVGMGVARGPALARRDPATER